MLHEARIFLSPRIEDPQRVQVPRASPPKEWIPIRLWPYRNLADISIRERCTENRAYGALDIQSVASLVTDPSFASHVLHAITTVVPRHVRCRDGVAEGIQQSHTGSTHDQLPSLANSLLLRGLVRSYGWRTLTIPRRQALSPCVKGGEYLMDGHRTCSPHKGNHTHPSCNGEEPAFPSSPGVGAQRILGQT